MASKNMNAGGESGSSMIDVNPEASDSSKLGIEPRVQTGTFGSREGMFYGGDRNVGSDYMRAEPSRSTDKNMNAGNAQNKASNNEFIGGSKAHPEGSQGSRENMPRYGGQENKGKIAGPGAGANPAIDVSNVLFGKNKVFNKDLVLGGTGADGKKVNTKGYNRKPDGDS